MTRRTKLYVVMITGMVVYVALMILRPHITSPGLHSIAGIVAAVSIFISLIAALRVGRRSG